MLAHRSCRFCLRSWSAARAIQRLSHNRQWRTLVSSCMNVTATRPLSQEAGSTYNREEVDKFSEYAANWWNSAGETSPLHALNDLRVPLVCRGVGADNSASRPLAGLRVVDVGCGGGILSEPLARLGAEVLGVDASPENVQVAQQHAAADAWFASGVCPTPQYRCCTVEQLIDDTETAGDPDRSGGVGNPAPATGGGGLAGTFDAVVASEVVEHVDNQALFLQICCRLLKPGGSLFVTTLNRTRCSWLLNIVGAEHLARVLPLGTHDWNKFVTPDELAAVLSNNGLVIRLVHGMMYNPLTGRWRWCASTNSSYAIHAQMPHSHTL